MEGYRVDEELEKVFDHCAEEKIDGKNSEK